MQGNNFTRYGYLPDGAMVMVKRSRTEPLRYQIRNAILELLIREKSKPGDQIPTEQELMDLLNVSRSTLREGLHLLEEERIIRTIQGSGRYLAADPKDIQFEITRLQSVTEMLQGYGIQDKIKVLNVNSIPADEKLAGKLDCKEGDAIVVVERLRLMDDIPIIYSIDMINESLLTEGWKIADFEGSLLKILDEKHHIHLDYSRAQIRVLACDSEDLRGKVDFPPGVSWILLEQVNYNNYDQPVIYSKDYHHGEFIVFNVIRFRY